MILVELSGLEPTSLDVVLSLAGLRISLQSACIVNGDQVPLFGPGTPVTIRTNDRVAFIPERRVANHESLARQ